MGYCDLRILITLDGHSSCRHTNWLSYPFGVLRDWKKNIICGSPNLQDGEQELGSRSWGAESAGNSPSRLTVINEIERLKAQSRAPPMIIIMHPPQPSSISPLPPHAIIPPPGHIAIIHDHPLPNPLFAFVHNQPLFYSHSR